MMEEALILLTTWQAALWHGFLVFIRVSAAVALVPGFGQTYVPPRVKLGIAIAFTIIVAPAIPVFDSAEPSFAATARYSVTEALSGVIIGLSLRMFILALQTAGSIAAQSTSLAQLLGGAGEPMPAIGHLLMVSAIAFACTMGLHVHLARFFINSYMLFPPGVFPIASIISEWGVSHIASAFGLAFKLSAPFMMVSALYNLMLGVINRAMPQLMVALIGAPLITFGGLSILLLTAGTIITVWWKLMETFMFDPSRGML
ncbi:flagellar biosynthetic protein FliR [Shimia isoporae]|uniref:Flagellar biosynthetic protein FliR n=1 Tax=Shimia isoporae TaxID=647720 RepID=A0A4R1N5T9_9RHOB|nr:flagellar biosynthetic protein FliR [Shimia isoporae]TCL01442.1 flagellar biosynthetic protein FliR [Shimia isoporae]